MSKRILWLLNHTTLREFEVPLLIKMGYEVYCPKIYQIGFGDTSASCTDKYDYTLTLPMEIINKLNTVNFNEDIPIYIKDILNKYFDIAMCMFVKNQAKRFAKFFNGQIILRWFGALNETSFTELHNHDTLELFRMCGNRFWFGCAYENLKEIECDFLRNRTLYMPIGIKKEVSSCKWVGGDKRILFVCPKIETDEYYKKVYTKFKEDFKDFDYIIGGNQLKDVIYDSNVVGYLPKEEYEYNMTHLSCIFYHSREKYHLHYHPIEAVKIGMPLVFLGGGMLDFLGGIKLPGRCNSIKEAKQKIQKLISNDRDFIDRVRSTQKILLERFDNEYCLEHWKKAMSIIEESILENKNKKRTIRKLGVILPIAYTGGVLDVAKRFCLSLSKGIDKEKSIKIVFGYPDEQIFEDKDEIIELRENGIECRAFKALNISSKEIDKIQELRGYKATRGRHKDYGYSCILDDNAHSFEDCEYLIYMADRSGSEFPVFTEKPYAMIIHDIIQRYVPESVPRTEEFRHMIVESYKRADHLFALSTPTKMDCIQYSGIESDKISILPLMYDFLDDNCDKIYDVDILKTLKAKEKNFFVWSTNPSPHKNHIRALKSLVKYYQKGGRFDCYITGANTQLLNPYDKKNNNIKLSEYILKIHNLILNNAILKKHLHFAGNLKKDYYHILLKNAAFFFHPGYADNGNMAFFDAACLGVPTISHDYPAMRYCSEFTHIGVYFVDAFSVEKAAKALMDMEQHYKEYSMNIPSREVLNNASINNTWKDIFSSVIDVAGL